MKSNADNSTPMWSLILPPLIVIVGIGAILWYLSRRMDDPEVIDRLSEARDHLGEVSQTRSLSREAFFLKIMEKTASKFKTGTLRMHNFFQSSLERLRKKRVALDEIRQMIKEEKEEEGVEENVSEQEVTRDISPVETVPEVPKKRIFSWRRLKEKEISDIEPEVPAEPVVAVQSQPEIPVEPVPTPEVSCEEEAPKPVLQDKVTKPDQARERVLRKDAREEMLIARIAENPRDTVAYEELGDHYFAAKNLQDAKACYRQALKLHPTNRAVKIKIRKLEKFFEEGIV